MSNLEILEYLNDDKLREMHTSLHKSYTGSDKQKQKHHAVTYELWKRNLEHNNKEDSLDQEAPGVDQITEALRGSLDEFTWISDFISLSGDSLFENGEGDLNLVVKCRNEDGNMFLKLEDVFFEKLKSRLEEAFPKANMDYIASYFGASWTHVPIADLAIVPKTDFNLRIGDKDVDFDKFYKRLSGSTESQEVQIAKQQDRVDMFRPIPTPMPLRSVRREKPMTVENVVNKQNYPCIAHRGTNNIKTIHVEDGRVKIMDGFGDAYTDSLQPLVTALENSGIESAVLVAGIEAWTDEKRVPYFAYEEGVYMYDVYNIRPVAQIFDILYLDGDDLHNKEYKDRLKVLQSLEIKQSTNDIPLGHINKLPTAICNDESELSNVINLLTNKPSVERVDIKENTAYPFENTTVNDWTYYANTIRCPVRIHNKIQTDTKGYYTYSFSVDISNMEKPIRNVEIGMSAKTDLDLEEGSVVLVEIELVDFTKSEEYYLETDGSRIIKESEEDVITARELIRKADEKNILVEAIIRDGVKLYKAKEPTKTYPKDNNKSEFVLQRHCIGKNSHVDLRYKLNGDLAGWTIADQIEDSINKDIESEDDVIEVHEEPDNWLVRWENGEVKDEKPVAIPKSLHASHWLEEEGEVSRSESDDEDEQNGYIHIFDQGTLKVGALKEDFREYFLDGENVNGRIAFRKIESNEDDHEYVWLYMYPEKQRPYVLSESAVEEGWMPPEGVSALPTSMEKSIPSKKQYWTQSGDEALESRKYIYENFEKMGFNKSKSHKQCKHYDNGWCIETGRRLDNTDIPLCQHFQIADVYDKWEEE